MSDLEAFKEKFRIPELVLWQNASWTWSLRPTQPTLGSSAISLNREASMWSDLSPHEGGDLVEIVALVERATKVAFQCERVNLLLLMHFDKQIHFHAIPRYTQAHHFGGIDWIDAGWPGFPTSMQPGESGVEGALLGKVMDALKAAVTSHSDKK